MRDPSRASVPGRHPSPELLQALIDGDLEASEAEALQRHLADCESCAAEVKAWRDLYSALDGVPHLDPPEDLTVQVMARLPTATRPSGKFRRLLGHWSADDHLDSPLIEDWVEGVLPKRLSARLVEHASSCAQCATELTRTRQTFQALSELGHLAPSEGFADRVLAAMNTQAVPESAGVVARLTTRLKRWARRWVPARPRTMEGWATLCGFGVTPTVCLALVFHSVLSHPAVGPRELAQYVWWQLGELANTTADAMSSLALDWAGALGGTAAYRTVSDQPEWLMVGALLYGVTCSLGATVLYRMAKPRIPGAQRARR